MHIRLQIGTAVKARKRTFLNETAWKTIPWSKRKKSPKDLLMDVLAVVPYILEEMDRLKVGQKDLEESIDRFQLVALCSKLDKDLEDWYRLFGTRRVTYSSESDSQNFIDQSELGHAHVMTLYWTICIVIFDIFHALMESRHEVSMHTDPDICCRSIIEVLPLFLHPAVGISRVHLATVPMSVVMTHLALAGPDSLVGDRIQFARYLTKPECKTMRCFLANMEPDSFQRLFQSEAIRNKRVAFDTDCV